jgi:LysM repeat protein
MFLPEAAAHGRAVPEVFFFFPTREGKVMNFHSFVPLGLSRRGTLFGRLTMKMLLAALLMLVLVPFGIVSASAAETYTVRQGDTLGKIGRQYGVSVEVVRKANPKIKDINHIENGWTLRIPTGGKEGVGTVRPRETTASGPKVRRLDAQASDCPRGRDAEGYCPYGRVEAESFQGFLIRQVRSSGTQKEKEFYLGDKVRRAIGLMGLSPQAESELFPVLYMHFKAILSEKGLMLMGTDEKAEYERVWKEWLRTGKVKLATYDIGDVFLRALFGNLKVRSNVKARWYGYRNSVTGGGLVFAYEFSFASGERVGLITDCWNLVLRPPAPPETPPGPGPGPRPPVPPVPTPVGPPEEAARKYLWDADAFVFYGQDHDEERPPTKFGGVEGAFYPLVIDRPEGRYELGAGGLFNFFEGESVDGFRFGGYQWGVAPAGKFYGRGWDANLKAPMLGQLIENGKSADGREETERNFDLLGFGGGVNFYQRQVRGEKWLPETQVFARAGFPIGSKVSRSRDGRDVSNTGDLEDFDGLVNVGARQILYDGEYVRPYVEAGYFGELPTSESVRFQVGISDRHKIVFAGIGPNFNLTNGGISLLWSVGIDPFNLGRYIRGEVRRDQFRDMVEYYDEDTGGFTLPEDGLGGLGPSRGDGGYSVPKDQDMPRVMPEASQGPAERPPGFEEFL